MADFEDRSGLSVDPLLVEFIEEEALPGTGIAADSFWSSTAAIFERFAPENRALLARRDDLQAAIDDWHGSNPGTPDPAAYRAFLEGIGYLQPEPAPFTIATENVDDEVALLAGPQLVVPALNARFVLNAANARWGSLYDALYGTDVIPGEPAAGGYDAARGAAVIARGRDFLDDAVPLATGSWKAFEGGQPALADPSQLLGRRGESLLLRHHGLHIEVVVDRAHPIGRDDPAGIADILLEAALTTIVDLEDSVAAVDAEDKVLGYRNWLGLMRGELDVSFDKGGRGVTRALAEDRSYDAVGGGTLTLPGRSLLFVRNVGHLMTTPALRLPDGSEAPEGILDAIVTSLAGVHDLKGLSRFRNSRAGSIYIVKPKMHGPDECGFTDRLLDAVEDLLGLARHTIKVGVMDEERRTSANLAACIQAVKGRIVFINTGFLDRTGDEIHTSMHAGAMVPKAAMKGSSWLRAYEQRNVAIGLGAGLSGRGQIGKGMWAAPDRMAAMLDEKGAQLDAGATTAWVPSPTAATLHALHYHAVDPFARHRALGTQAPASLNDLLSVPLVDPTTLSREQIAAELDNNIQSLLGYVVRWIDQGVGCSKVPDLADVALMEDRATLRISSQHVANWLLHGLCTEAEVEAAFGRMTAKVDRQNAGDPAYRTSLADESIALEAARALVFTGMSQPSGYTEPLLHASRRRVKAQ